MVIHADIKSTKKLNSVSPDESFNENPVAPQIKPSSTDKLRNKARALHQESIERSLIDHSPTVVNSPQIRGPRILIVDDIFFNVDILKEVLQKVHKINTSQDLVEAYNGKQAF